MTDQFELHLGEVVQSPEGPAYTSLQFLGAGGNAATYLMLATTGPNRGVPFAVKFFRRLSKPEWKPAFMEESKFLEDCDHPAVIRYYDRGIARDEHPFFVADYLPRTLRGVIREGRTPTVVRLTYAVQLLSALTYLADRTRPVVHRDVKPENIFIKSDSCVLGDFGLIKFAPTTEEDRQAVKESLGAGMPRRYRTPDLVDYLNGGEPPTAKSDVYQLGLVLAELFTGWNPQKPSRREDLTDPVELAPLGKIPGSFHDPISQLIGSMLDQNSQARPSAAEALDLWFPILLAAARQADALDGRVL